MHLEGLCVFCDLVELQSFSKTAEKHLLSQSAVSQQLAQLELLHKCQLINRNKRPIEITREGELFYKAARDMLERYAQLCSGLSALSLSQANKVNVAAIFSIGMYSLAGYVKKFMVRYPKVNMHVEYLSAAKIYGLVLSGEIDIAIVAVPKMDKRLHVYEFESEPLVLACSPKHPLAGHAGVDIRQLQFERFIAFDKDVPTRRWIDGIFERYKMVVHPVMEFDNIETVKRAVEINSGVSILPEAVLAQELAAGTIRAVSFTNERFVRPTGVIVRRGKILSDAARYFVQLLRRK